MKDGKITVLICDSRPDAQHDVISAEGMKLPENPIPVVFNFSHDIKDMVGLATLELQDKTVYAKVEIFPAHLKDERLKWPLYPAIGGQIIEKKEGWVNDGSRDLRANLITKCSITQLSIGANENVDSRIKPQHMIYEEPPIPSTWRSRGKPSETRHVYDRTWGNSICYKTGRVGTSSSGDRQCTLAEWHEFQKKAKRVK